jgi:hypothetical protein
VICLRPAGSFNAFLDRADFWKEISRGHKDAHLWRNAQNAPHLTMGQAICGPLFGNRILLNASRNRQPRLGSEPLTKVVNYICIGHMPILSATTIFASPILSEAYRFYIGIV